MQEKYWIHIILLYLITIIQVFGQKTGMPFISNFSQEQYNASQQNWAIAQDHYGVMYFANTDGVLVYDGISWQLIKLPVARSLAIDKKGLIYVGLANDFGYLETDQRGNYQYRSLKEKIPEQFREFNDVWKINFLREEVIFQTYEKIFILKNDSIKILLPNKSFHFSFVLDSYFYVTELGKGLLYLNKDSLDLVKGGERFAFDAIWTMLPIGRNEILIGTRQAGVTLYSPENPDKFRKPLGFKEVDNFLLKNPASCGAILGNGDIAIGAITGGIIAFDQKGMVKSYFNKNKGLQNNVIYNLYSDHNKQLWAALENGISLIQYNLPFSIYSDQSGLNGTLMSLKSFNNSLYAGTSEYLHLQNSMGNFDPIPGTEG